MNTRIKELLEQSCSPEATEAWYIDPEKFATLIVKECCEIAHPKLHDVGEWAAGMRLVQKRIKEHFGVKE